MLSAAIMIAPSEIIMKTAANRSGSIIFISSTYISMNGSETDKMMFQIDGVRDNTEIIERSDNWLKITETRNELRIEAVEVVLRPPTLLKPNVTRISDVKSML